MLSRFGPSEAITGIRCPGGQQYLEGSMANFIHDFFLTLLPCNIIHSLNGQFFSGGWGTESNDKIELSSP